MGACANARVPNDFSRGRQKKVVTPKKKTMWSLSLLALAHVPTYDGNCLNNCCTPPHTHTTSQVIYLKGSGGLEIHIGNSTTTPFNIAGGEIIDVDAVFRDKIDPSTYALYIGCGGCVASEDRLINASRVNISGYQPGEVEPFTQTRYHSVFKKEDRKYNASLLGGCTEGHFTIRLVDLDRSRSEPIVWAAVIGLGERFTFVELLEFPVYILRNHGYVWNQLGYTYWIWLFVGAPLIVNATRELLRCCGARVLDPYPCRRSRPIDPREPFYELAIIGFVAAGFEELTHLIYVQAGVPVTYGLYVGLFLVILLPQGVGILFTVIVWRGLHHRKDRWCTASPYWAPLEIATGFSLFFLFGAGFFVGPAAIMIAGVIRLREACWLEPSATHGSTITVEIPKHARQVSRRPSGSSLGVVR